VKNPNKLRQNQSYTFLREVIIQYLLRLSVKTLFFIFGEKHFFTMKYGEDLFLFFLKIN